MGGREKIELAVGEVLWWLREYESEMIGLEELKIRIEIMRANFLSTDNGTGTRMILIYIILRLLVIFHDELVIFLPYLFLA